MLHRECRSDFVISYEQIVQMFTLMRKHEAAGLAAPQVGIDARLFITHWAQVFVNPVIAEVSVGINYAKEGCLSLPGQGWYIPRRDWVLLATGEKFEGLQARVIQHELDHLNGVLINE